MSGVAAMSRYFQAASRFVLMGLEREPVVTFSVALATASVGLALVVPPLRRSWGGEFRNLNTGRPQTTKD